MAFRRGSGMELSSLHLSPTAGVTPVPPSKRQFYELVSVHEDEGKLSDQQLSVNLRCGRRLVRVGIGCMIDPLPQCVVPLDLGRSP